VRRVLDAKVPSKQLRREVAALRSDKRSAAKEKDASKSEAGTVMNSARNAEPAESMGSKADAARLKKRTPSDACASRSIAGEALSNDVDGLLDSIGELRQKERELLGHAMHLLIDRFKAAGLPRELLHTEFFPRFEELIQVVPAHRLSFDALVTRVRGSFEALDRHNHARKDAAA
jgi:hypothetical protein